MLLSFSISNYKSFYEDTVFSMTAADKQKGLDYSLQKAKVGSKVYKGLSSAVIYGPNASGKTNLICALDTFKSIVLRGNIRNSLEMNFVNPASSNLELIPMIGKDRKPTKFSIQFYEENTLFEYTLKCDLGDFLSKEYERKIVSEELVVNNTVLFSRIDKEISFDFSKIKKDETNNMITDEEAVLSIAKNSLNSDELFLVNGFKTIISKKLAGIITDWFEDKLLVYCRSDKIRSIRKFENTNENMIYIETTLTEIAKEFGINSNALAYRSSNDGEEDKTLYSVIDKENGKVMIPSEIYESYGTIRMINEFPLILRALVNGGTLVVDEFDASIHPMALMNLVRIFHNDEVNLNKAQLIFNTHNPIFLNAALFRRDEIKFVERDDSDNTSIHYSLSDFGTSGSKGVRKDAEYMKNYFINRYGAVKEVDFTPIIENVIQNANSGGKNA